MKTVVKEIKGNWNLGYTLDKHMLSSTPTGENEQGHMQFHNVRTEVGEAVYLLKYKNDETQAHTLALAIYENLCPLFENVGVIIPMAASTARPQQPVHQVVSYLAGLMGVPWYKTFLNKSSSGPSLKNVQGRDARVAALAGTLSLNGGLKGDAPLNVLVVDDLYQTGASIEAACALLATHAKIGRIYVAALTRKF